MQYMLLIYTNASDSPEAGLGEYEGYLKLTQDLRNAGIMRSGEGLDPPDKATTVRVRDGKTKTSDGPFAETKEVLGGFYVIECDDLDTAIEWASRIPSAVRGSIEVRPVMEYPEQ